MRFPGRASLADGGGLLRVIDHLDLGRIGDVDQRAVSPFDPATDDHRFRCNAVERARQIRMGGENVFSDARREIGTIVRCRS